jgi:hypothetical protein
MEFATANAGTEQGERSMQELEHHIEAATYIVLHSTS